MNDQQRRQWMQQAMDHSLGQLKGDPRLAQRVMQNDQPPRRAKGKWTLAMAVTLALVLAAAVALAFYGGLLDFLHLPTLGRVQTVQPKWRQTQQGEVNIQVMEAASDGISAHLLLELTGKNAQDALLLLDDSPEQTGIADQYAGKRVLSVTPMELETGEASLWPNVQSRYLAANRIQLDITVDLRNLSTQERLTLTAPITTYIQQDTQAEEEAVAAVEVTLPLQKAAAKTYTAVNLPISGPGYVLKSLTLTQTDMACYLDTEWEDDVSLEEAMQEPDCPEDEDAQTEWQQQRFPLGGSFWVKVLDEKGTPYQNLNGGESVPLGEEDECNHILISTFVQRFSIGETLTIQPFSWDRQQPFDPIVVKLAP